MATWKRLWHRLRGIGTARTGGRLCPGVRYRALSFQCCDPRLTLSAAGAEPVWLDLLDRLERVEDELPAVELSALPQGPATVIRRDGPELVPLDDEANRGLDLLSRIDPAQLEFAWGLRSREMEVFSQLPPTPWCDDEFRDLLNELLLPETGYRASDWLVQVHSGVLPTTHDDFGTGAWEAATLIDYGLNLDGTARFRADLVQLVYPKGADGSTTEHLPALYTTVTVSMEWSNLEHFWGYSLAGDLVDLVNNVPLETGGTVSIQFGYDGFGNGYGDTGAAVAPWEFDSDLTLVEGLMGEQWVAHNVSAIPPLATTDVALWDQALISHVEDPQPWNEPTVSISADTSWGSSEETLTFGPQKLDYIPSRDPYLGPAEETLELDSPGHDEKSADEPYALSDERTASEQESAYRLHAADASFAEDVTKAGFQHLTPSDLQVEPTGTGLVDLNLVSAGDLYVLAYDVAHLAHNQAESDASSVESSERGSRTRLQEFDLVAVSDMPAPRSAREATSGSTGTNTAVASQSPPAVQPGLVPPPPVAERPAEDAESVSRASSETSDRDAGAVGLTAYLRDASWMAANMLVQAPGERAAFLTFCVVGQVVLRADIDREISPFRRGPRLRA